MFLLSVCSLRMIPATVFYVAIVCSVNAVHEHGILHAGYPNPVALGFEPVPLNASYDHVVLKVSGEVPQYLKGTLFRGAPGAWPDGWWLDGLITLNAFKFEQGKVVYTMAWNKDQVYNQTRDGTEPPKPLPHPQHEGCIPQPANSTWPTGVAFRQVQGQILGSTGVSNANSFNGESLQPIELPFAYDDDLSGPYLSPTHDMTMDDGTVLHHLVAGIQNGSGGEPKYIVTSIKPGSRARDVISTIERPKESSPVDGLPSFIHMPLATDEFYVMLESNCYYPDTVTNVGNVDWKGWKTDRSAKSHVRLVNRSSGESLLYPLRSNVFGIHHINAFYDKSSNSVVVDTIQIFPSVVPCNTAFKNTDLRDFSSGSWFNGLGFSMSKPVRLTLPLDKPGADVEPRKLTDVHGLEFPTIRYDDLNGKPYQFVYANYISHYRSAYYDSVIKVDVNTGAHVHWTMDGAYPGEPIFVPNPEGKAEDDGVVMTNVLDSRNKETFLLILDAKTMKEVARAGPTPHVIPHGYHGRYFDRKLNAPSPPSVWV